MMAASPKDWKVNFPQRKIGRSQRKKQSPQSLWTTESLKHELQLAWSALLHPLPEDIVRLKTQAQKTDY